MNVEKLARLYKSFRDGNLDPDVIKGRGWFELKHYDKDRNLIWDDAGPNSLSNEGQYMILDSFFRANAGNARSTPTGFQFALVNDTPVKTDLLKDLTGEPTTNSYARQALTRDATGWPTLALDSTDYMLTSAAKTFLAGAGGGWGPVTYALLLAEALGIPAGLTVTPTGTTGATSWGYAVLAIAPNGGKTLVCATVSTATGNATLSVTNYNALAWTAVPNATGYDVYRLTAGGTPNTTGLIASAVATNSYNDVGAAGSGVVPVTDTTPKLIAYKALSQSRTLAANESIDVTYKFKQQ